MSSKPKLSIAAQFHQLDEQLAIAKFCFKLYQNIALDTSTIDKPDLKRWINSFANLAQAEKAIISQTLFIQLHKFFDKNSKSIHLSTIIEACRMNPEHKNINQKYKSLLKDYKEVIKKLRNRVYAHTDVYSQPEDLFEDIKTSYTDLNKIILIIEEILQAISAALQIARCPYVNADDVQSEHKKMIVSISHNIN